MYVWGAVVCAENEQQAKETHPSGDNGEWVNRCSWVKDPSEVQVRYLGVADESVSLGVVLDSYSEG